MPLSPEEFRKTQNWYPYLADRTFLTSFVKLRQEEISALGQGEAKGHWAEEAIARLAAPMSAISGNCFVYTDCTAPTDTRRFAGKGGAVYSPQSAWRFLAESEKIKNAAQAGQVSHICIRPFRRINQAREFRLFIHDGKLKGMSQYWLIRHFRRLEGPKEAYWRMAKAMVSEIAWVLPVSEIVMDIYITSDNNILIIDLNPWGPPTNPLLFHNWEQDWSTEIGLKLIPPPLKISGDVNVSF